MFNRASWIDGKDCRCAPLSIFSSVGRLESGGEIYPVEDDVVMLFDGAYAYDADGAVWLVDDGLGSWDVGTLCSARDGYLGCCLDSPPMLLSIFKRPIGGNGFLIFRQHMGGVSNVCWNGITARNQVDALVDFDPPPPFNSLLGPVNSGCLFHPPKRSNST